MGKKKVREVQDMSLLKSMLVDQFGGMTQDVFASAEMMKELLEDLNEKNVVQLLGTHDTIIRDLRILLVRYESFQGAAKEVYRYENNL